MADRKGSLKVCVIGAGPSGLVATKELLDEGHQVECFERQPQVGGNFNYPAGASYDDMKLTVSNFFMAYSSYAPELKEERRHWTRREYLDYLESFTKHFGLDRCLRYGVEVQSISRTPSGEFVVKSSKDGEITEKTFDAVAVCQGAHRPTSPRYPTFEGRESFKGEILHTADYKNADRFKGKRVLCVGFGETAADVADQISAVASECCISFRRYPSLVGRGGRNGFTNDADSTRLSHAVSRSLVNKRKLAKAKKILAKPHSKPHGRFLADWWVKCGTPGYQFLQKNDDFVEAVISGQLNVIASGIDSLENNTVNFTNGEKLDVDIIMCCTGYQENGIPNMFEGTDPIMSVRSLYKHMLDPDLGSRVAFIGWARPIQGGVPACSEMQSRYFALLCSGKRKLPGTKRLRALIKKDREREEKMFYVQAHIETLCLYTAYLDSVAKLVGCKPRLWTYVYNPRLLHRLLFGSNICQQYRLRGPHNSPETAKRVIMYLPSVPMRAKKQIQLLALVSYSKLRTMVGVY
jgi:dimethylaniline monooxygenase (N-oxide forming)